MADEVIDAPEADEQVSAPDLRETIVAAVAEQREKPEPEVIAPDKPETEGEKPAKVVEGRDEKGRFAAKSEPEIKAEAPQSEAKEPAVDSKEAPAADDKQVALAPPTSWSPTAKVEFEKLPLAVQQAVAKREEEVNSGFAKFREFKPIEPYVEMAKRSGTTLDRALENYIGIENELRRDMISGVATLCRNQGLHPVKLANEILARYGTASQTDGAGDPPQAHQPAQVDPAILNKLNALETAFTQQRNAALETEISRFASKPEHKFFENVKSSMGRLLDSGQAESLEDAYEKACWANKEIRELLIKQQTVTPSAKADDAVQRARAADKATGGAPSSGYVPAGPKLKDGASIREIATAAVAAQRGL